MQKSIFRKSSLERISSPEQLNEYVKITNPGVWAVLLGLFALLIAVAVWAYAGSIPETVQFTGVVYAHEGEE
jgi:multidrug efflux pump subunit AcrA (membrane-fusion protein)